MGIEHVHNAAASTEVTRVHLGPNMPLRDQLHLQAVLMLRRYAREHKDIKNIDCTHPRRNSSEVQAAAMGEWVGEQGPNDVRGRYRAFIDRVTSGETDFGDIDLTDEAACAELIARIESEQGPDAATETLH